MTVPSPAGFEIEIGFLLNWDQVLKMESGFLRSSELEFEMEFGFL